MSKQELAREISKYLEQHCFKDFLNLVINVCIGNREMWDSYESALEKFKKEQG